MPCTCNLIPFSPMRLTNRLHAWVILRGIKGVPSEWLNTRSFSCKGGKPSACLRCSCLTLCSLSIDTVLGDRAISRLLFTVLGSLKLMRLSGGASYIYCIVLITDI